jgi:hypothetical protein
MPVEESYRISRARFPAVLKGLGRVCQSCYRVGVVCVSRVTGSGSCVSAVLKERAC